MSARASRGVVLAAVVLALGAPAAAQARTVRAFAVGPKFSLTWTDSTAHFRAKLFALVDRRRRAGAPPVQAGADDVASHLRGPDDRRRPVATARDLVVLPEDLGLMAAFTGSRGSGARAVTPETGGLVGAVGALLGSYAPVSGYYGAKFPSLTTRGLPTRLLAISLTDTFARTAVETYAEIADRYDVWLEGGVNMAQSWKVVCVSRAAFRARPGAPRCDEENPGKVATLRSPDEPTRDYAYEATTPKASNMALVFDPDGHLVSRQVKTYTTPIELPNQLDLVPGEVSGGLTALRTPVGTLGFVTSKDAWMPDVLAKLDAQHVDLLVQPEFFVNDTVRTKGDDGRPVMWAPDTLKAAGYADVLRQPSIEAMVLAELTGNVYDFSADAQQHIVVEPRTRAAARLGLIGQAPAAGFASVAPWLVPDLPRVAFAERRRRLGLAGEAALPLGSGPACASSTSAGACKGGQVEGVIWHDVTVARRPALHRLARRKRAATPFTVNRPLAPSRFAQRHVALAARGRVVLAAFEERRPAGDRILLARSADGGRTWGRPVARGAGWWPAVAIGAGGRAWVAWQDARPRGSRVRLAASTDGGRSFGRAGAVTGPAGAAQWKPALAASGAGAVLAWVDERERSADDDLPQAHILAARVAGSAIGVPVRLDAGLPVALAAKLDNAWAPALVARGRHVLASWTSFRTYNWDVYARESLDAGATWAAERRVNDTPDTDAITDGAPDPDEALDDGPAAALTARGPLVAFTDFRKRTSSASRPHQLYDVLAAAPGGRNRQVDASGTAQLLAFAPAIVPDAAGALVAWEDHRRGPGDVLVRAVGADGRPAGPARRVGDTGPGAPNQWRPALAPVAGRVLAAWEDERDGPAQVFFASASASALR